MADLPEDQVRMCSARWCIKRATRLCDFWTPDHRGKPGPCDAPVCEDHRHRFAHDPDDIADRCPRHQGMREGSGGSK